MPSDAVLAFDTSGPWCAAAVIVGGATRAFRHLDMARGQAEALMPLLDTVLADAGLGWSDFAAIGVGVGPGNFTGIRISVATARGLSLALGVPAIGVDRFAALALDGPCLPVAVPALRGEHWLRHPDGTVETVATLPEAIVQGAHPLPVAIGLIADTLKASPQPRPAPLYLRDADAAPPSSPPPALIG